MWPYFFPKPTLPRTVTSIPRLHSSRDGDSPSGVELGPDETSDLFDSVVKGAPFLSSVFQDFMALKETFVLKVY